MAILAERSLCHKKQSVENRVFTCGEDLVKTKRSKKVRYRINYRQLMGKQRREVMGYFIQEGQAAEGKRNAPKV